MCIRDRYHNELYGYIEAEGALQTYRQGKAERVYNKINRSGGVSQQNIILTEYIRHQIHHPENKNNPPFTAEELSESISAMREFIQREGWMFLGRNACRMLFVIGGNVILGGYA